jgi:O-antigen/teichoic acid export membrane protein
VIYLFWKYGLGFLKQNISFKYFKDVLKFGLPVGVGFAIAAIYTRIDQILLFNILGKEEAGIYGFAYRIATVILFASFAFNSALNPRFASLSPDKFIAYFKKASLATGALALSCLVAIPLAPFVIPPLFGQNYAQAVLPFQILVLGSAFFVLYSPFNSAILYRYKKPYFSLIVSVISLVSLYLLLMYLIPVYKSVGTAMAISLIYFCQLIISVLYFGYLSLNKPRSVV